MVMADTIELAGKPVKKQTVMIAAAAAAVLGIGIYRYRKQQAADAATQSATDAAGTGTGTADQIDPATGFPYGSVEDASALTSQAGYNSPIGGLGTSGVSYSYAPGTGYPQGFTSNAQWSQAVEDYLVNTTGADANTVGNALGKYITGQELTADQQAVVNQGIAFQGYPPVAGPDGYPPHIRTGPAPTPTPTPTPGGTVYAVNPPTGLHLLSSSRTGVTIGWNATQHATSYTVNLVGHGPSNTNKTYENIGSLKPNTSYTVQVWANPTKSGGPHATLTFRTKR